MSNLMLHCGGEPATFEDLGSIALPERTETYHPVAHQYVVDRVRKLFQLDLGLEVQEQAFGLARGGAQMFGVIKFRPNGMGTDEWGPSVGIRNSYDKSLSIGVCMGLSVFVCDNLAFSGDALTVLRKHTSRVLDDLNTMVMRAARTAAANYHQLGGELKEMKLIGMDLDQGFAELGVLFGREVLNGKCLQEAARYWRKPPHEEHQERTLYSWYQAANSGLKLAPPSKAMVDYTKLHHRALEVQTARRQIIDIVADS